MGLGIDSCSDWLRVQFAFGFESGFGREGVEGAGRGAMEIRRGRKKSVNVKKKKK